MFTLPFDIPDADDIRLKDLIAYRKKAIEKAAQATLEAHAAVKVIEVVESAIVTRVLRKKGIEEGNEVIVDFQEGEEVCKYEGTEWYGWDTATKLRIRRRNKNKKWAKHWSLYGMGCLALLKKHKPT